MSSRTATHYRASQEALLQIDNLRTWFELRRLGFIHVGHVRAVDGVDFQLHRGEAVAIVGESGCGKSTFAKSILGVNRPTDGEIRFAGRPIRDVRDMRWYRRQVGFVQQDPYGALPPFMNVRRILEEPLIINGVKQSKERDERLRQALSDVKLTPVEEYLSQYPHMLSGGQQQRLVIARAIILRPQLIVADEPVSMLDASVRIEILELLRRLQEMYNLSIIYITHDLSTVRYFAHRICVMYGGKIVEESDVDTLVNAPRHPYSKALLAAIPDPDPDNVDTLREVPPGEPPSLLNPPSGCRFHPRCDAAIKGLCDVQEPPTFSPDRSTRVACWLYQDESNQRIAGGSSSP